MRGTGVRLGGLPARGRRQRSAEFIATYQDRLAHLATLRVPALVMSLALDTNTFAARAISPK